MIYRPRIVTLLFAVAAFSQLAPIIASVEQCSAASTGLPNSPPSDSAIQALLASQCPNLESGSDCTLDLTSLYPNVASTCAAAGGEVYDLDYSYTCPSQDADGSTKIIFNNYLFCAGKICTTDDVKTGLQAILQGDDDDTCTVAVLNVASDSTDVTSGSMAPASSPTNAASGSMAMSVSTTTLLVAIAVGIFSLVDTLV